MNYTEYSNAQDFIEVCKIPFRENEALYGLMWGIAIRLEKNLLYYGNQPLMAAIHSQGRLDLIALMTPPYKLQIALLDNGSADTIQLLAQKLIENHWDVPAVMGERGVVKLFSECWEKSTGAAAREGMAQRIYDLRTVNPIVMPEGEFRQAGVNDLELALEWKQAFDRDCFGESYIHVENGNAVKSMLSDGNIYFWENPYPVSMAALTRPTPNGISISFVYTPPQYRRQGYASAVTARLSKLALESGRKFCALYTDLSNPTSNSIYQKIGYRPVADIIDVVFSV